MSIESKSDSEENFEDAIDTLEIEEQVPATTDLLQQQAPNVKLNQKPKFTYQASIPPPMGPPPPLPQDFSQHPSTSQIPPPLPPRRPLPRNPELSIAIPSIEIQENAMIQTQTEKRIPDQQIYGRQRGHTKTNSLDRGLISLAKCMKTGPFPPPTTSKSNSLTRGASPSDILPTVDEQDTQAQGVIQGVIQQVLLSDNPYLADEIDLKESNKESSSIIPSQDDEMENSKHKEIISDKIQSNASAVRRKAKSTGGSADERSNERTPGLSKKSIVPHYENLAEQALPKRNDQPEIGKLEEGGIKKIISTTVTGNSKKRIDEKQHRRSASDKSPTKVKTASAHHQKQKSSTWEPNHKTGILQKPDSIDPITRDVERRMSLKEKGNMSNNKQHDHNEANDASSSEEVFGQKHSAIEHIRRYGNVASDYLRGTMQKVRKQAAILTKSGNKSGKIIGAENDRDGASSVAESDELSLANCISETLPVPLTTPLNRRMRATNSAEPPNSSRTTTAATTSTIGICKPKNLKKGPFDFEQLRLVQELNHEHTGAIWCIKFSDCGRLLATAGQDRNVRVWVLRSQLNYFTSLRERYGQEVGANLDYSLMQHIGNMRPDLYDECVEEEEEERDKIGSGLGSGNGKEGEEGKPNSNSSKGPKGSLASSSSSFASSSRPQSAGANSTKPSFQVKATSTSCPSNFAIFSPKPFCVFRGHTADVLDLSWSPRNYFILSSGMDRTVKLWHLTRNECLCSFQHVDFVTCIAFMPKDDRYFISGSLDGKIRLWNIPEKRVAIWNEVEEQFVKYITAIAFVKSGKFVVVGTYSGRCFFYSTDQLKYHTVIDCRSSKAKNSRDHTKITALGVHGDKLLSNDSRIRIYDLRDMDLCCKFKGAQIEQSHIRAAFSPDGKYIVSGSEDNFVYLWRTSGLPSSLSVRKDRNHAWERIRAHQTVVTTAAFAPKPQLILSWLIEQQQKLCKLKMQPIASSTPEPTMENNISPPPITARADKNGQQSHQSAKERYSNSVERPFLALASRLALPTANLTDIQLIKRSKPSNASLGYSSSMLSIASAAAQSVNETMGSGRDRRAMGDVIVSADLGGSLKIFVNATRLQTGASNFFPY